VNDTDSPSTRFQEIALYKNARLP